MGLVGGVGFPCCGVVEVVVVIFIVSQSMQFTNFNIGLIVIVLIGLIAIFRILGCWVGRVGCVGGVMFVSVGRQHRDSMSASCGSRNSKLPSVSGRSRGRGNRRTIETIFIIVETCNRLKYYLFPLICLLLGSK